RRLGSHARARHHVAPSVLSRESRRGATADTKSASEVHTRPGTKWVRCLYRCSGKTRWKALPARMENLFGPLHRRAGWSPVAGSAIAVLLMGHWSCGRGAGRFRPQAAGRDPVFANVLHGRPTSGI